MKPSPRIRNFRRKIHPFFMILSARKGCSREMKLEDFYGERYSLGSNSKQIAQNNIITLFTPYNYDVVAVK